MAISRLIDLRLTAFKSFLDAVLPLGDATIITGRNGAGKSNALDGLDVLARLAGGEDLADALDGRRREAGPVRGGSAGCPPHGHNRFTVGCTVEAEGDRYVYDVTVEVAPALRVVAERLAGPVQVPGAAGSSASLFETREVVGSSVEVQVGGDSPVTTTLRNHRLVLAQMEAVASLAETPAPVARGVGAVLGALRGVFHLDPLPQLMRDFVPARLADLQRSGANLSAALYRLSQEDPAAFAEVEDVVRAVAQTPVRSIDFVRSDLGDVMLALTEETGRAAPDRTPAREMSDGLLRLAALATALRTAGTGLEVDAGGDRGAVLLVVEEPETGLHPAYVGMLLDLVAAASADPGVGVLLTTHSPALLDAVEGRFNDDVVVCHRAGPAHASTLTPLVELPDYATALAEGTLGAAVTAGRLVDATTRGGDHAEFDRLVGIG